MYPTHCAGARFTKVILNTVPPVTQFKMRPFTFAPEGFQYEVTEVTQLQKKK